MMSSSSVEGQRYDRQIRLWGPETQQKLSKASLYVKGYLGVAAEVAKNLALSGIGHVYVESGACPARQEDYDSNLLLQSRAMSDSPLGVCLSSLRALNPFVDVKQAEGKTTSEASEDSEAGLHVVIEHVQSTHDVITAMQHNTATLWVGLITVDESTVALFSYGKTMSLKYVMEGPLTGLPRLVQKGILGLHGNDSTNYVDRLLYFTGIAAELEATNLLDDDINSLSNPDTLSHCTQNSSSGCTTCGASIAQHLIRCIANESVSRQFRWLIFDCQTHAVYLGE